jgi:hypothetical protein
MFVTEYNLPFLHPVSIKQLFTKYSELNFSQFSSVHHQHTMTEPSYRLWTYSTTIIHIHHSRSFASYRSMFYNTCGWNAVVKWPHEETRHAMYVQRNIEARSYDHSCCGKAKRNTYSECVFVALDIQHAMRRTAIRGLPGSTIFFVFNS